MSYIYYYSFQLQTELLVVFNSILSYSKNRNIFSVVVIFLLVIINQSHYHPVLLLLIEKILPFTYTCKVVKIYLFNPDLKQNTRGWVYPCIPVSIRVNLLTAGP